MQRLLSAPGTSKVLGISPRLTWDLVYREEIPHVRLGRRRVLIPEDDLAAAIQARTVSGNAAA